MRQCLHILGLLSLRMQRKLDSNETTSSVLNGHCIDTEQWVQCINIALQPHFCALKHFPYVYKSFSKLGVLNYDSPFCTHYKDFTLYTSSAKRNCDILKKCMALESYISVSTVKGFLKFGSHCCFILFLSVHSGPCPGREAGGGNPQGPDNGRDGGWRGRYVH